MAKSKPTEGICEECGKPVDFKKTGPVLYHAKCRRNVIARMGKPGYVKEQHEKEADKPNCHATEL